MSKNDKFTYISRVQLKGYKSIRDLAIDLLPGLNIIIGPNGSGKTNFLTFLADKFKDIEESNSTAEIDYQEGGSVVTLSYASEKSLFDEGATPIDIQTFGQVMNDIWRKPIFFKCSIGIKNSIIGSLIGF